MCPILSYQNIATLTPVYLLGKNIRCDHSQGYIQDLSLGWVNVLARMNVHPNAQA